jgi:hypothetical protein
MVASNRKPKVLNSKAGRDKSGDTPMEEDKTSIQLTTSTRDRLYRLKFRRTYDQFINELCDLYEQDVAKENER